MRVGAIFSQADSGTDPDAIRRWAIDAEAAGFEHLLAYDHILGASPERLGPGPFGSFPNAPYTSQHTFHEILVLLSHLAAITTRMSFVPSVLVLPQRQTAAVAKQVASIDLLSGGRIRLAVGVGWNAAEYEALGVDFADRTAILEEQIDVIRMLWTQPIVDFHGRFHHLQGVGINPLPTHVIPLMIGSGASDAVLRRVVRKADGWMPLLIPGLDAIDMRTAVAKLR
ncbi:MAG TPA: TIGR03619 family F420-dependent LLM class oxidoreductase, partial [Ilumatobacteraceae bacterium]|nr:TIGR03619 family F420-dependent LLM class oxidoreductase [Ilumatobacteraceae bacterium]